MILLVFLWAALCWFVTSTLGFEWWAGVLVFWLAPIPLMAVARRMKAVRMKVGAIASLGRKGSAFVELYLDTGERVALPHAMWEHVQGTYQPGERLIFVERRGAVFHFVHWVGNADESRTSSLAESRLQMQDAARATRSEANPG